MKRHSIAAISLLVASTGFTALANDSEATNKAYHNKLKNSCDSSFNADMKFSNNQLTVITANKEELLFDGNGRVVVAGQDVSLSSAEQKLAQHYYQSIEQAIPMVTTVALEAINITNIALSETFTALLGENSQLPQLIDQKLSEVSNAIEQHVYQNPESITFDSTYFENDLGFGDSLENEIDEITEELMSTAMGEMLMLIGRSMMSGDGDTSDFEKRMESLGEEIEIRAEALAKELERKAESLCEKLKDIDDTENQLQSIHALRNLNMVDMHKNKA